MGVLMEYQSQLIVRENILPVKVIIDWNIEYKCSLDYKIHELLTENQSFKKHFR